MQKYNHYTKSSTEIAQCFKFVKTKRTNNERIWSKHKFGRYNPTEASHIVPVTFIKAYAGFKRELNKLQLNFLTTVGSKSNKYKNNYIFAISFEKSWVHKVYAQASVCLKFLMKKRTNNWSKPVHGNPNKEGSHLLRPRTKC